MFGRGSGVDALIAAAGGVDVGTELGIEDSRQITAEAIVNARPDAIVVTTTGLESVGGVDGLLEIASASPGPRPAATGGCWPTRTSICYGFGPRTGQLLTELVREPTPPPPPHEERHAQGTTQSRERRRRRPRPPGRCLRRRRRHGQLGHHGVRGRGGDDRLGGSHDRGVVRGSSTTAAAVPPRGIVPGANPEVDKVVAAYSRGLRQLRALRRQGRLPGRGRALRPTLEAYSAAGGRFGGIKLVPTAVVINGDQAAVTYDVLFGTTTQYRALKGEALREAGAWKVSRKEFCSFMASARTPCPTS